MSLGHTVAGMCYMCVHLMMPLLLALPAAWLQDVSSCAMVLVTAREMRARMNKVFMVVGYFCALMFMFV
jgi:hypothetical protein